MGKIRLAEYTIFDTPLVEPFFRFLSHIYLKAFGWRIEGNNSLDQRFVMIAAPHTSNWDLPMMLAIVFVFRIKLYWFGKDALFHFPRGAFFRWLGGIAINREKANNMVEQSVKLFAEHEKLVLVIPPEGTRKSVRYWKSGFYHIAHGAQVPIVLGFIDFKRKIAGTGGTFHTTGDVVEDMKLIRLFYAGITGKNPHLTSEINDGD